MIELSKHEAITIIKVHFECYDSKRDITEEAAEHLHSCLQSAKLDKSLERLDLSKYVDDML